MILATFCVQQPHVFSGHRTVQPGLYAPDLIPLLLFSLEPTRVRVLSPPCTQFVLAKVIVGFHDHFMFSSQLMTHQRHLVQSITLFLNCFLEFLSCSFFAFSFSVSFAGSSSFLQPLNTECRGVVLAVLLFCSSFLVI